MIPTNLFPSEKLHTINDFTLADFESTRLILHGGRVVDWRRHYMNEEEIEAFLRVNLLDLDNPHDAALVNRIRDEAIVYLKETFDFPIPAPVRRAKIQTLLRMAANESVRHRQLCACMLLKAMHIINHFDASEARQGLKLTDSELFSTAEKQIYRVVSQMMAEGMPVVEFMGGRKQRASMITKLLSKKNPLSAQLFDKMRFRVITATRDDILPVINYLSRNLFPFNYVLAGESYNTLMQLGSYAAEHDHLQALLNELEVSRPQEDALLPLANTHSSPKYQVVHWVADMPLKIPNYQRAFQTSGVNPVPRPVVYVRVELQILDRRAHRQNERGDASHRKYKSRQLDTVSQHLKLGLRTDPQ